MYKEAYDDLQQGGIYHFKSPYDQMKHLNGMIAKIDRIIDAPDENHDAECLPMYKVSVFGINDDGFYVDYRIEAWPEELHNDQ